MLFFLGLLFLVSNNSIAAIPTAQYANIDYDVVYVRCPRGKEPVKRPTGVGTDLLNWNGVNDLWLSAANNIYQQPGCDLVLHKSAPGYAGEPTDAGYTGNPLPAGDMNRERVLVNCDENNTSAPVCTIADPTVSFDGKSIVYAKFTDTRNFLLDDGVLGNNGKVYQGHTQSYMQIYPNGDGPNGYASRIAGIKPYDAPVLLFRYDLTTGTDTQISPTPSFLGTRYNVDKNTYWSSKYPVMDTGPIFLPNGKIMFTSNRASSYMRFQLFTMDIDGSNLTLEGHRAMNQQLHPFILKDGRVIYTSHDTMLQKAPSNNYSLFQINQDGSFPFIFAGKHDATMGTYHYGTQLSNGDVVVTVYYNHNNSGLGSFLRFPADPVGPDFEHRTGTFGHSGPYVDNGTWINGASLLPFARVGQYMLTADASPQDRQAGVYTDPVEYWIHPADGRTVTVSGKYSHPSGAPGNDLLATYSIGGSSSMPSGMFADYNKTMRLIGKDAGIWLLPLSDQNARDTIGNVARDARIVVDHPEYHEIMGRAVVPYMDIYGQPTPDVQLPTKDDGTVDNRISAGEPYGLSGAATLYDRETRSLNGIPWGAKNPGGFMAGRNYMNLEASGAELAIFDNKEVYGVRVVMPVPPVSNNAYGGIELWAGKAQQHHMRILGEFPVRKADGSLIDAQGNPDTSFLLKIPANTPFLFQSLDKNGMALDIETTSRTMARGERQLCGGCHVHTRESLDPEQSIAVTDTSNYYGYLGDLSRWKHAPLFNTLDGNGIPVAEAADKIYPALPGVNARRTFAVDWDNGIKQVIQVRCASCHVEGQSGFDVGGLKLQPDDATYKKLTTGAGGCCRASRWLSLNSARSSMLIWALYGKRMDGRNPATGKPWGAEGEAIPANIPERLRNLPIDNRGLDTVDIWPNVAGHLAYVSAMPESEKRLIARWIDMGAPKLNTHDDAMAPVLTLTPRMSNGSVSSVLVGLWDDSGIDYSKFSVTRNGVEIFNGSTISGAPEVVKVSLGLTISKGKNEDAVFDFKVFDATDRSLSRFALGKNIINKTERKITGAELLHLGNVAINNPPTEATADVQVCSHQASVILPHVTDKDLGDSHFFSADPNGSPAHGDIVFKNGAIEYISDAGYTGPDGFRYRVNDLSGMTTLQDDSILGTASIDVISCGSAGGAGNVGTSVPASQSSNTVNSQKSGGGALALIELLMLVLGGCLLRSRRL